jgi:hypothetical protein
MSGGIRLNGQAAKQIVILEQPSGTGLQIKGRHAGWLSIKIVGSTHMERVTSILAAEKRPAIGVFFEHKIDPGFEAQGAAD